MAVASTKSDKYGADWATSFFGTLRRTGYTGAIVVFRDTPPDPLLAAVLKHLDVEVELYKLTRTSKGSSIMPASLRYIVFRDYLRQNKARFAGAKVLLTDSRDVFFQLPPFVWPFSTAERIDERGFKFRVMPAEEVGGELGFAYLFS